MTVDDEAVERLVDAAKAGDPEAFGSLFDHYHGPVYRYVAARVGRPSDAEDLAQLVFVKALEALPRYESRGVPFGGWLFRLARNVVIDHVRTRREHAPLDLATETSPSGDDGPDELAALRQEMDSVARRCAGSRRTSARRSSCASSRDCPRGRRRWRWAGRKAPSGASSSGPSRRSAGTWASSPTPTSFGPGVGDGPVNEDRMTGTGTARGRRARAD